MTILRQSAMRELERLPEDKITFVLQIMRGINGLDEDERLAKKNAVSYTHLTLPTNRVV